MFKPSPSPIPAPVLRLLAAGLTCLALLGSGNCAAEIYKFVDDNGHVTYTNMPRPGAKKLQLEAPTGKSAGGELKTARKHRDASNPSPTYFPRVDSGTQRKRDDMRRQLLTEELVSEERNLNAARSAYAGGRRQPGADLTRLLEAVRLHEKNIEMLNKELAHIR
jgi:hypothetical protein